jgi:hypothetical protein
MIPVAIAIDSPVHAASNQADCRAAHNLMASEFPAVWA